MNRIRVWLRQGPYAEAACNPRLCGKRGVRNVRANRVRAKAAPLQARANHLSDLTSDVSRPDLHRPAPAFKFTDG
jgi:hypothetical protein